MKRIAFAFGLALATAIAAPLAAQSRNDGPWWDPANTGGRRVDTRDGRIYADGRIYDSRRVDGQWRREGRDRNGRVTYVRLRYDRNGNLIRERARRDVIGRYRIIQTNVIQHASRRHDRNDRWERNRGHDGRWDNSRNKSKNKNQGKSRNRR